MAKQRITADLLVGIVRQSERAVKKDDYDIAVRMSPEQFEMYIANKKLKGSVQKRTFTVYGDKFVQNYVLHNRTLSYVTQDQTQLNNQEEK